jgi:hypothetical protein
MGLRDRLFRFAEWFRSDLQKKPVLYLCCLSALYLATTSARSAAKLLWYDELFTIYISRLSGMAEIWAALTAGADLNPPLFYAVTRGFHALFGEGHVATRLPAILGFWIMSLCLFQFVSRRCSPVYGFMAMLFPLVTRAYWYAFEARPYGLVLGFCGLSLLSWQYAADGQRRKLALPGLTLGLAGALLVHCYAVLLLLPLVAGEIVRTWKRNRLDRPVWISIFAATPAVLLYLPLFESVRVPLATTWAKPELFKSTVNSYFFLLDPPFWPLVTALILITIHRKSNGTIQDDRERPFHRMFPSHEVVTAVCLAALPLFGVLLAIFVTGIFTVRYALPSIVGISILFAFFTCSRAGLRNPRLILPIVAFLVWFVAGFGWFVAKRVRESGYVAVNQQRPLEAYKSLPVSAEGGLPVVVSDGRLFLQLVHYAPASLGSRLFYLRDEKAALRYTQTDVLEQGYPVLQKWFPVRMNVEDYDDFVAQHDRFMVYGPYGHRFDWVIHKLKDDGAQLTLLDQDEKDSYLFLVTTRQ